MNKYYRIVLSSLVLFLTFNAFGDVKGSVQQDFQRGVEAYKQENYQRAFAIFKPLAEGGDAVAQFSLGVLYRKGLGVIESDKEAIKWFKLSAQQGNALAQFNLGFMYGNGRGVERDYKKA